MTAEHASTSGWTLSGRHIVTVADRDNISALGDEVYDNTENLHYLVRMLLRPLAPIEIRLKAWQQAAILRHNMLHNVQAKRAEVTAICRAVEPSVGERRPKSGVFLFTKFAQNKNKILRIFHQKKDFEFSLLVGSTSEDRQ